MPTADNLGQRVTHAERCHWSEGRHNKVGVTAGNASHNTSNTRGVTAGKMGRNSSRYNTIQETAVAPKYSENLSIVARQSKEFFFKHKHS